MHRVHLGLVAVHVGVGNLTPIKTGIRLCNIVEVGHVSDVVGVEKPKILRPCHQGKHQEAKD